MPTDQDQRDTVASYLAAEGPAILEHVNDDHEDSVLLVGRVLGDRAGAHSARITAVDPLGIDLLVADAGADHAVRVDFDAPLDDPTALSASFLALLGRARTASGGTAPLTSMERDALELDRTRTFLTTVTAVEDVHDHLRRVTLHGDDLHTFTPVGPDTFLYFLLPPPGRSELTVDHTFAWSQVPAMPADDQPVGAYYTVRAWRPEQRELDFLMVLHGETGPASAWAGRARPGDPVALWGPRTSYHPPADTDSLVLVADETGLPALAAIVEQAPAGLPILAIAEVAGADEHQDVPARPGLDLHWLHRDGVEAGTTTLLVDHLRGLELPGERPYVWGGGESRAVTAVRKHVRSALGLPRDAVSLVGYWRHEHGPG